MALRMTFFRRVRKNVMREEFVVVGRGRRDGSEPHFLHQKTEVTIVAGISGQG